MKKLLLIEDNFEISENIKEYLELEEFQVDSVSDGADGLDKAMQHNYDLILLDLMLPNVDGFTIAKKLQNKSETPIIMITAKDSIDDKLLGFDYGISDYIVKPFDLRELEARINSIFKRKENSSKLRHNDLEIDIVNRTFIKANNDVLLTQKEFLILELLVKNRWKPISRTDIIEHAWWGGDAMFDSDSKLDVYISNLRHKLSKDLIHTIKWFGYKVT